MNKSKKAAKPANHKRRNMNKSKKPVELNNGRTTNFVYDVKLMIEALPKTYENRAITLRGIQKAQRILNLSYLNKTQRKSVESKVLEMEKALKGNEKKKS
jgi:hypothetical protein